MEWTQIRRLRLLFLRRSTVVQPYTARIWVRFILPCMTTETNGCKVTLMKPEDLRKSIGVIFNLVDFTAHLRSATSIISLISLSYTKDYQYTVNTQSSVLVLIVFAWTYLFGLEWSEFTEFRVNTEINWGITFSIWITNKGVHTSEI